MLDIEKKLGITLSGISDEAGVDIHTQIKAHKELGWSGIELRLVNGKNVAGAVSDIEFEEIKKAILDNEMKVTCFSSALGNWSRNIQGDFQIDIDELTTATKRMKQLGTKYIRCMSWVGDGAEESYWKKESIRRYKELAKIAEAEGIYLAHENCTGWGGLTPENMIEFEQAVNSPNLVLLYDLGNVPQECMDPESYFNVIRGKYSYIHIKDGLIRKSMKDKEIYKYCGEGDARVAEIMKTVIKDDGYNGFISIEPHIASVVHLDGGKAATPEQKFVSYIKYGRKLMEILNKI